MNTTVSKKELQERAQLVRLYEASCAIAHPSDNDLRFRQSVHWKLDEMLDVRKRHENPKK